MNTPEGQKLLLRAMTLRGIGPYRRGARLELRPLTILCGPNGSGKSTWFRALRALERSLRAGALPFRFLDEPIGHDPRGLGLRGAECHTTYGLANALLSEQGKDERDPSPDEAVYGPPGSIGLELEVVEDTRLDDSLETPTQASPSVAFLRDAVCPKGLRLHLRVTHVLPADEAPTAVAGAELQIGADRTLRLRRDKGEYTLEVSTGLLGDIYEVADEDTSFLAGKEDEPFVKVASLHMGGRGGEVLVQAVEGSPPTLGLLVGTWFGERFRQVLDAALSAVFYIGAIRPLERRVDAPATGREHVHLLEKRHVGPDGSAALPLLRSLGRCPMKRTNPPFSGWLKPQSQAFHLLADHPRPAVPSEAAEALRSASEKSRLGRVWGLLPTAARERIGQILDGDLLGRVFGDLPHILRSAFEDVLSRRDLYDPTTWKGLQDVEARFLIAQGVDSLDARDLRRLNRLLIEASGIPGLPQAQGYDLETFVGLWLKHLLGIPIVFPGEHRPGAQWQESDGLPDGFLHASPSRTLEDPDDPNWHPPESLEVFAHPCFGNLEGENRWPVAPALLSAGFHQVAPLVVQAGLMRENEVMLVENPEVHLHPGLQLELAGFFVEQANSGRIVVLETHSDLIVRRALRAIVSEGLSRGQEGVRIYFTHLEADPVMRFKGAVLESIRLNDKGQVDNWPTGFLDDDVEESRRLMEAMYPRYFPKAREKGDEGDAV